MITTTQYQYTLPEELIALEPAEPRDSAKLLVYKTATDELLMDTFANLAQYLPQPALMVFNNTKVLPSRLTLFKQTGGKVVALFLLNEQAAADEVLFLADRKIMIGDVLQLSPEKTGTVTQFSGKAFTLRLHFPKEHLITHLLAHGSMPLPPYLKKNSLTEAQLRQKYQTVFAEHTGSVAAPTASLHFTPELLQKLQQRGIDQVYTTLHVGRGTFAPVTEEQVRNKKLHLEHYDIPNATKKAIETAKKTKTPVIAVGTTVIRTLESGGSSGATELFIYPPYEFKVVDAIITNFHVPGSSLMMLVDAFLQHKKSKKNILELYAFAINHKFRFFSFGDGMLIV